MPTITIPKKLTKPFLTEEVAVIPRKEYDALVRAKSGAREPITVNPVRSSRGALNPAFAKATRHSPPRLAAGHSASNGVKRTMKVPKKHEKFYDEVDRRLTEALREVEQGKVSRTFDSVEELIASLES